MATAKLSAVIIDVRLGECLALSDDVTVELVQKSGQLARLRIIAPRDMKIEKKPRKDAKGVPSMTE